MYKYIYIYRRNVKCQCKRFHEYTFALEFVNVQFAYTYIIHALLMQWAFTKIHACSL